MDREKLAALLTRPQKSDQDGLDACLCLLVALHIANGQVPDGRRPEIRDT